MNENRSPIPSRLYNAAKGGHVAGAADIIDDAKGKTQEVINKETDNALENRYTKNETYSKTELNNLITTPEQKYVTLTAKSGDTLENIFNGITGAANTIYRVGSWDGSQYNTTKYAEYGWDGTNFVPLDVKEYGIDDEPIAGSDNLVKSGGVAEHTILFTKKLDKYVFDKNNCVKGYIKYSDGSEDDYSSYWNTNFVEVDSYDIVTISTVVSNPDVCIIAAFDKNRNYLVNNSIKGGTAITNYIVPQGVKYIKVCTNDLSSFALSIVSGVNLDNINKITKNNVDAIIDLNKTIYGLSYNNSTLVNGKYYIPTDDIPYSSSNYASTNIIKVAPGDVVKTVCNITNPQILKLVAFNNGERVSGASLSGGTTGDYIYIVPEGVNGIILSDVESNRNNWYLFVYTEDGFAVLDLLKEHNKVISFLSKETSLLSDCFEQSKNLYNPNDKDFEAGYFLNPNAPTYKEQNDNYAITGYIPFSEEDGYMIASKDGKAMLGGAYIFLYNANKEYIGNCGSLSDARGKATWATGTAYVRFSIPNYNTESKIQIEKGSSITDYVEYGVFIKKDRIPIIDWQSQSLIGQDALKIKANIITDGSVITTNAAPYHLKKGLTMSFYAKITEFGSITIGKGNNKYRGDYITVDNINIIQKRYEESELIKATVAHGLSITDFIKIILFASDDGKWNVILQSKNGYFQTDLEWTFEANYQPFVKSVGTVGSDVVLTCGSTDFKKAIWMYGDSYFGVSSKREIGVLKEYGYFNFLCDGLAGQTSDEAFQDLVRCLNFGTPKYLVWALGMNDASYDNWLSIVQNIISICEHKNIKLILCTIPSVSIRDNTDKNTWIKASGIRYIDLAKAVNGDTYISGGNSWYSGYLSSDNIHPTELGAQALATQFFIDFPELMQYGRS